MSAALPTTVPYRTTSFDFHRFHVQHILGRSESDCDAIDFPGSVPIDEYRGPAQGAMLAPRVRAGQPGAHGHESMIVHVGILLGMAYIKRNRRNTHHEIAPQGRRKESGVVDFRKS